MSSRNGTDSGYGREIMTQLVQRVKISFHVNYYFISVLIVISILFIW
jgi:hypothetical protein